MKTKIILRIYLMGAYASLQCSSLKQRNSLYSGSNQLQMGRTTLSMQGLNDIQMSGIVESSFAQQVTSSHKVLLFGLGGYFKVIALQLAKSSAGLELLSNSFLRMKRGYKGQTIMIMIANKEESMDYEKSLCSCRMAKYRKGMNEIHKMLSTQIHLNLFFMNQQVYPRYCWRLGQEAHQLLLYFSSTSTKMYMATKASIIMKMGQFVCRNEARQLTAVSKRLVVALELLWSLVPELSVQEAALSEFKKVLISSFPPEDPCSKYRDWQSCIGPYVDPMAPNPIGSELVATYVIAMILVMLEVNPDILPRTPNKMSPAFQQPVPFTKTQLVLQIKQTSAVSHNKQLEMHEMQVWVTLSAQYLSGHEALHPLLNRKYPGIHLVQVLLMGKQLKQSTQLEGVHAPLTITLELEIHFVQLLASTHAKQSEAHCPQEPVPSMEVGVQYPTGQLFTHDVVVLELRRQQLELQMVQQGQLLQLQQFGLHWAQVSRVLLGKQPVGQVWTHQFEEVPARESVQQPVLHMLHQDELVHTLQLSKQLEQFMVELSVKVPSMQAGWQYFSAPFMQMEQQPDMQELQEVLVQQRQLFTRQLVQLLVMVLQYPMVQLEMQELPLRQVGGEQLVQLALEVQVTQGDTHCRHLLLDVSTQQPDGHVLLHVPLIKQKPELQLVQVKRSVHRMQLVEQLRQMQLLSQVELGQKVKQVLLQRLQGVIQLEQLDEEGPEQVKQV